MNEVNVKLSKWSILIAGAALAVSIVALSWNIITERARSTAQIEVWQRNAARHGSDDDREQIILLIRNLSYRPTAIVDIFVRKEDIYLQGSGYRNQITLPLKIDPWGVTKVDFRIENIDRDQMTNILVRDMEDNEVVLRRGTGQDWIRTRSKSKSLFVTAFRYLFRY